MVYYGLIVLQYKKNNEGVLSEASILYTASHFPQHYHGLFVTFYGSWNRSAPTGYKVVFIPMNSQGQVTGPAQDFATGWLQNDKDAMGRPVGLAVGHDGGLYVSDDKAGTVYRVTYSK